MKQLLLFCIIFQLVFFGIGSATNKDSISTDHSILYEKVYLHIDRELYAPGDDIWFKSYLVSGINNQLIPGYKNIYVQLISDSGKVTLNKLLLSQDGIANGDFKIPVKISDGSYTVRAYTKYLKNFGEESFFHKKIVISNYKSSLELENGITEKETTKIDVSFLPESGSLVENAINHIAFKVIDESGKGINIKGKIVDETGNEVVSFKTTYKGMGKFIMMPQEGKTYFAEVEKYPDFTYQFKPAVADGICLNYKSDGNYLLFTLTRNLKTNYTQDFVLTASHKGIELFHSKIAMKEFQHAQKLYKGLFPLGISKITLSDLQNNVVAERMVFVRNSENKTVELNLDKKEYKTREKVEMDISSLLAQTDTIYSSFSVAVVHEDYFSASGNNQTIESYLLLDSELKGAIESPASYFVDEENISVSEKLDLVMMVNGWRSYYWNDLEKFRGIELPNWADIGLTLKGKVIKQWGKKPADLARITLGPFSSGFRFEEETTDFYGNFSFDRLYLKDSALIMINAKTKNGSRRTEIQLEPYLEFDSFVDPQDFTKICPDINVPMKFYRNNYFRKMAEREYTLETGGVWLEDIEVKAKRPENDGHFRLHIMAEHSYTFTDDDQHYFGIPDFLEGRYAGVYVDDNNVSIRNAPGNPLFMIDGIPSDWYEAVHFPIGDIDKIEVLKSGFSTAAYGSRGANGVIAVYTKMGFGEFHNEFTRIIHGRITPRVRGFQQVREFYSPQYTYANINDPKPDYRPTLLWNPNVILEKGEAVINFFTSDNLARYRVIVEGISKSGKICSATALLSVSVPGK